MLLWLSYASYTLLTSAALHPFLLAFSHLSFFALSLSATSPPAMLTLLLLLLVSLALSPPSPFFLLSSSLLRTLVTLALTLCLPLAVPGPFVDPIEVGRSLSPEDYTSLFGWLTFSWVYPLIHKGHSATLNESDVWNPSPTMQSRPVFSEFNSLRHSTLLATLWAANSLDLMSYWMYAFLVFLEVLGQGLNLMERVWTIIWGEAYDRADQTAIRGRFEIEWPDAVKDPLFYVAVYAVIGIGSAMMNVMSVTAQYIGAFRASRVLFEKLLVSVVRATFRFYDTTPTGRMLNRFGRDIEVIDMSLVESFQYVNSSLATIVVSIITICVVFPSFLPVAVLLGFGSRHLVVGYLSTARDLKRMESNTRSPIYSDFAELLEGIATVRAFSVERQFLDSLHSKIDLTTEMWYTFWMTNRWLLLNLDVLGTITVFITMLFSIATLGNDAGIAGLCISTAMGITSAVYFACCFCTNSELDLNAVERVNEYLDIPQEPLAFIESIRPPAYWPSNMASDSFVVVENLVVKYAPKLPTILHNISFTLKAGERVGILGPTGSGKSTLVMSLLRFVDPTGGRITVDGIDISTIGVHDLRSRIVNVHTSGCDSVFRDNLDPFGEYTDAECLDILRRVNMIPDNPPDSKPPTAATSRDETLTFDGYPKSTFSLETQISVGGTSLSQGQRQLISLGRALLRRNSIIVLDEATSGIDFVTDAKIQSTIREEFPDSLLLTVAHRLRTIIDYDRFLVLDKGQIAEIGSPWTLIQKENGMFRKMCLKSGSFDELEAAACQKAERAGHLFLAD